MNTNNIYLGDCLEIMKDIPDKSTDAIICDLPFGSTALSWDSIISFELLWAQYKRVTKPGAPVVLFGSQPFTTLLINSNFKNFKYNWIWKKNRATNFLQAKRRPLTAHEEISIFIEGTMKYNPQKSTGHKPTNSAKGRSKGTLYHGDNVRNSEGGDTTRFPTTILEFKTERGLHPTQKPVPLLEYLIKTYSNEGDTILDNCCGSGSTCLAAKNTGRNFVGIEKDENYFNVAKKRLNLL